VLASANEPIAPPFGWNVYSAPFPVDRGALAGARAGDARQVVARVDRLTPRRAGRARIEREGVAVPVDRGALASARARNAVEAEVIDTVVG